jgi:hypothetical protein
VSTTKKQLCTVFCLKDKHKKSIYITCNGFQQDQSVDFHGLTCTSYLIVMQTSTSDYETTKTSSKMDRQCIMEQVAG